MFRYFVTVDPVTGRPEPVFVVRLDGADRLQTYSVDGGGWVDAPDQGIAADVVAGRGWVRLPDDQVGAMVERLRVSPGYWLTVTASEDEPKLLVRTVDGHALEGYAVSSARWESMGVAASSALNDPGVWQPIPEDRVAAVQGWLHGLWDQKVQRDFDARAPELVDLELTEAGVCRGITWYTIEILKHLPDGLTVGFQAPDGGAMGSCGSGPFGPRGAWNFQVGYRVWGFPPGANYQLVDDVKRLFDAWGWTDRYEVNGGKRHLYGQTSTDGKRAYQVAVETYPHGQVFITWTSPYYPGDTVDHEFTGMRVPSVITKDGIQSWEPPVYPK